MIALTANMQATYARIAAATAAAGRPADAVRLLAVSKTFGADRVAEAAAAGQRAFGENYLQEAVAKIEALRQTGPLGLALEWHFIGPLQSNKTRPVAEHFDWVHSVDRLKIAERLSAQRPDGLPPLKVLLQVNIDDEGSKSGVTPAAAPALAHAIAQLPRLALRGLMTIPRPAEGFAAQRTAFAALRRLRDEITATGLALPELSMGMSADLEAAIAEGATMVRVGTAIFGVRQAN
ncbi:MAG: YggS family pyridoxal phosphate-dependent enzyme [Burkholderiales bacterium]